MLLSVQRQTTAQTVNIKLSWWMKMQYQKVTDFGTNRKPICDFIFSD